WRLRRSRLESARLEDRHVSVGGDFHVTSEKPYHFDDDFTLLVLLGNDLLASIESLSNRRREGVDRGFQCPQIGRRGREVRSAGHAGLKGRASSHDIRVEYIGQAITCCEIHER